MRGVALLAALALGGCKTDLYTKLSEREANEMVALLLDRGIDAARVAVKDGTSTVQVDQARFAHAVEILKAGGYPHQTFATLGEVFKGGGLIASPTEERARYIYALSQELSKTVSDIDGVLSARIHVVLPKNDLLKQDATPSSASVFIRYDQAAPVKALLPQIKMLVANSIEGLNYEKIAVVFVPVERPSPDREAILRPLQAEAQDQGSGWLGAALAVAGVGGVLALAGGGFWYLRRRRGAEEAQYGALEPLDAPDAALPPPGAKPAAPPALKRVA
nr:type III secretion inner membrane ring lipoprotein SctJ [Methylobacterium sp. J-076]